MKDLERRLPVVPLSPGQLLDVNPANVLGGGLYRLCDTHTAGGGYDSYSRRMAERTGMSPESHRTQFVVQLRRCPLDCHYCYVTRQGVWGAPAIVSVREIARAFEESGADCLHLMGGAPALYMWSWPMFANLVRDMSGFRTFHSDLLLIENEYDETTLDWMRNNHTLYAIDVKGLTDEEWEENTRKPWNKELFWRNWRRIQEFNVPAYVTMTGCDPHNLANFWIEADRNGVDAAHWASVTEFIDLINYAALPFVDDYPWGRMKR